VTRYPLYLIAWKLFLPAVLILFLSSCVKEEFDADALDTSVQLSPGVAAPIGYVHYRLEELFGDSIIGDEFTFDADGFITLRYKEEIASLDASDLFTFSDINHTENILNNTGFPIILDSISGSLDIQDTIRIPFNIPTAPGAEVDSIIMRSMDLTYSSQSQINGLVSIYGPFGAGIQMNGGSVSRQLTDLTIRMEHVPPNRNELVIIYLASITPSSGTIQPGESIVDLNIQFSNIDYSVVYGYLGQFSIPVQSQSIPVDLYDPVLDGTFHFEDAQLKISSTNSFGIPLHLEMTNFQATGRDGQVTFITGDSVPSQTNPRIIKHPVMGQEGLSLEDSILLTTDNTNLFDVLETAPVQILFGATGTCNPAGTNHSNFLLDTSRLRIGAELRLPLYGYADFLLITDTLDFIFDDFYDHPPEEIKSLTFRLNFTNGLPVNVFMQVYFADENMVVLDSLFTDLQDPKRLVQGATDTDGDGKANPLHSDPVEVELDREKIGHISSTRYIFVYGRFSTTGYDLTPPVNVRFYTDYFFTAHLGAIAVLDVNSAGL
jgi:hypothetical protein